MKYYVSVVEDNGTFKQCESDYIQDIQEFLNISSTHLVGGVDESMVKSIISKWADENLPPLPSKEMLEKLRAESKTNNGESHE